MQTLDQQLKSIINTITTATGKRSDLLTTDQTTFVAAINELKNAIDVLGTTEHTAADISARDALTGLVEGDRVFVADASADATVDSGWAIYRYDGTDFLKMAEGETLDVAIIANLSAGTHDATTFEVAIDTGTNVSVPSSTTSLAGLISAEDKTRLNKIYAECDVVWNEDYVVYTNARI